MSSKLNFMSGWVTKLENLFVFCEKSAQTAGMDEVLVSSKVAELLSVESPVPEGDHHWGLAAVKRPILPPGYLQERHLLHQPRLLEHSLQFCLKNVFDEVNIIVGHLLLNPVSFNPVNQECSLFPNKYRGLNPCNLPELNGLVIAIFDLSFHQN